MARLGDMVTKVRSKNAGPFWLTIDIFCGSDLAFRSVSNGLQTSAVAALLSTPQDRVKRFDIADLNVIKISVPRPQPQGTLRDRDMHGAATAAIVADMQIGAS